MQSPEPDLMEIIKENYPPDLLFRKLAGRDSEIAKTFSGKNQLRELEKYLTDQLRESQPVELNNEEARHLSTLIERLEIIDKANKGTKPLSDIEINKLKQTSFDDYIEENKLGQINLGHMTLTESVNNAVSEGTTCNNQFASSVRNDIVQGMGIWLVLNLVARLEQAGVKFSNKFVKTLSEYVEVE